MLIRGHSFVALSRLLLFKVQWKITLKYSDILSMGVDQILFIYRTEGRIFVFIDIYYCFHVEKAIFQRE